MDREFKVSSIEEYIKIVDDIYNINAKEYNNKKHLFFRGHSDKKYELLPTVLRKNSQGKYPYNEKEVLNDFQHYSPRHMQKSYDFENDRMEMLVEMQHYGMPTRILDWTFAPLNALFFAVSDNDCSKEVEVVVFNPWKYNGSIVNYRSFPNIHNVHTHARALLSATDDFDYINNYIKAKYRYNDLEKHHIEKPFVVVSNFVNDRILHQRGAFTIHGTDKDTLDKWTEFKDYSWRIVIEGLAKVRILDMLNKMYINHYSIYPDFYGMHKQVQAKKGLFNL